MKTIKALCMPVFIPVLCALTVGCPRSGSDEPKPGAARLQTLSEKAPSAGVKTLLQLEMEAKVRKIIEQGGDVNQRERDIPLLGWAVSHAATDAVRMLLENGADPNITIHPGSFDVVLFEAIPSALGDVDSGIDRARIRDTAEIVTLLLKYGADPNLVNKVDKRGAMHKAAANGRLDIAKILIEKGADITAKDILGNTPLHDAARYGCWELVQLLLARGVSRNEANLLDKTPLSLAKERLDEDLYKNLATVDPGMIKGMDYDRTIELLTAQ